AGAVADRRGSRRRQPVLQRVSEGADAEGRAPAVRDRGGARSADAGVPGDGDLAVAAARGGVLDQYRGGRGAYGGGERAVGGGDAGGGSVGAGADQRVQGGGEPRAGDGNAARAPEAAGAGGD